MPDTRPPLSTAEVMALHERLSNWGRWGERDQLGALNLITREKRVAAGALVRSGRTVSCARPLPTQPGVDNPTPVVHLMTATATEHYGGDYLALWIVPLAKEIQDRTPFTTSQENIIERTTERFGDTISHTMVMGSSIPSTSDARWSW